MSDVSQGFDFIVVGAGTAGCLLAARLSEDPNVTVCLIEAGGPGLSRAVDVPAALVMAQRNPDLNWRFSSVPQVNLNNRPIGNPRGRGLGGSALINGMVYFRGHPADYDEWARAGAKGWSYAELLPYFRKTENNENFGDSPHHGRHGPLNVRSVTHPNRLNFAFFDALTELGVPNRDDLTGYDTEGSALRQLSIRDGVRETTASALLRPAMRRRNLTVLTNTPVSRVVIEDRRATGVLLSDRDGRVRVSARREVVLCAGAIQSPQLLLLSGVGSAAHLADMNITLVHELPGVGRNLHDHLASPVHMSMRDATSYGVSLRAAPRNLAQIIQYALFRRGPIANNIFESAAFVRSSPNASRPDLQLVFQPARRPAPGFPFPVGHGFAISPVGLYPKSRGSVMLASPDPMAAPLIDPNLLSDPEDIQPLLRGIRLSRKIFASAAFSRYQAKETAPGPSARSDDELLDYIRAEAYTVHHPVSTCRMGTDDSAVVDADLRVRGLSGLRVADASIFPSIIGGNTNAAVAMVAEKAADLILGRPALTGDVAAG